MPIIKSAIKNLRKSLKKKNKNASFKKKVHEAFKDLTKLASTDKKGAEGALPKVFSLLDRAAKKNILHENKAARKKSQAAKLVSAK